MPLHLLVMKNLQHRHGVSVSLRKSSKDFLNTKNLWFFLWFILPPSLFSPRRGVSSYGSLVRPSSRMSCTTKNTWLPWISLFHDKYGIVLVFLAFSSCRGYHSLELDLDLLSNEVLGYLCLQHCVRGQCHCLAVCCLDVE